MLTKTEIETCCANIAQRFNALEETRRNIAQAFDTAIGNRLSALMANGLTRYNIPNPYSTKDTERYFSGNALKSSGCNCFLDWDDNYKTITMVFYPNNVSPASAKHNRYLMIAAVKDPQSATGADAVSAVFIINGLQGNCSYYIPLRDKGAMRIAETCFPEETRRNCNGDLSRPLSEYIRTPKDIDALVQAHKALQDYESRLRRIAHLVEAASEVLTALEERQGATERERDERVRYLFGLSGECATPTATVYRVKLTAEPHAAADGSEAK